MSVTLLFTNFVSIVLQIYTFDALRQPPLASSWIIGVFETTRNLAFSLLRRARASTVDCHVLFGMSNAKMKVDDLTIVMFQANHEL